jgi:hypothetical protein
MTKWKKSEPAFFRDEFRAVLSIAGQATQFFRSVLLDRAASKLSFGHFVNFAHSVLV